jgi:hypothetical protein
MSLLRAIFGAKPAYGTPPFAPTHILQTGGVAPVPAPGEPQHGVSGFFERVFNPTNALGQFGQALLAGGGGPLGNAAALMMQQRALQGQSQGKFNDWRQQYDYELAHPKPTTQTPDELDRDLAAQGIVPGSPDYIKARKLHADNALDPWVTATGDFGSYSGPRSGMGKLPGAIGLGQQAAPTTLPPIGSILPDPRKGGAGSNAGGNFRGR